MDKDLKAHLIKPEEVALVWEEVEPLISRATQFSEGEMLPQDFLATLTMGGMQLWIAISGGDKVTLAMVTQIIEYPQKKVLRVITIAGEDFKEAHERFKGGIEDFALRTGCTSMELWGRKGWKKMLPDWKDSYIVFTKNLITERIH